MKVIKRNQDLSVMLGAMESLKIGLIFNRGVGLEFQYRIAHNNTYRPVYPKYNII